MDALRPLPDSLSAPELLSFAGRTWVPKGNYDAAVLAIFAEQAVNEKLIAKTERAMSYCRRLFEALGTALKRGASWESRQEAADLLDELRLHVAKEQG